MQRFRCREKVTSGRTGNPSDGKWVISERWRGYKPRHLFFFAADYRPFAALSSPFPFSY